MDEPRIRLAPEPEPEGLEVESSNVVSLPERPGDATRRIEAKLDATHAKLDALLDRQLDAEPEQLDADQLAAEWARLKAREVKNDFQAHQWWEPDPVPARAPNRNGIFLAGLGALFVGRALWLRYQSNRMQSELDLLSTALGHLDYKADEVLFHVAERAAETVAPTIMARALDLLPGMVAQEVERARISPVHTTKVVERAVEGRQGRQGPRGRDGKDAKLTTAQVERITRESIRRAEAAALRELKTNPSKYRGQDGIVTAVESYEREEGILD